jgi:hypothetical protein
MNIIILDTETTGLPQPSSAPDKEVDDGQTERAYTQADLDAAIKEERERAVKIIHEHLDYGAPSVAKIICRGILKGDPAPKES